MSVCVSEGEEMGYGGGRKEGGRKEEGGRVVARSAAVPLLSMA